jgi:hypothetical protein
MRVHSASKTRYTTRYGAALVTPRVAPQRRTCPSSAPRHEVIE